jgi:membrane-bound metal-dependent hydrolase YbcI (DUF457 family)
MSMIASQGWISPTRATGLMAYATACICCGIAWMRTKARRGTSRLAAVLTFIECALLLDMAFNWRWKLHQALMDFAMREHEYAQRGLPQLVVVTLLGALLLFGWFFAWRYFRGRGTTLLAVFGGLLSLVMWCIEVVSLHPVDQVLYYSVDGTMAVALLWLLACTMTSIGMLLEPR